MMRAESTQSQRAWYPRQFSFEPDKPPEETRSSFQLTAGISSSLPPAILGYRLLTHPVRRPLPLIHFVEDSERRFWALYGPISPKVLIERLMRGISGIGRVEIDVPSSPDFINFYHIRFLNTRGDYVAEVQHFLTNHPRPWGLWEGVVQLIEVAPELRGKGLGTRLMTNSIFFFREAGAYRSCSFSASGLGRLAWAELPGLPLTEDSVHSLQDELRRLNRDHALGLSERSIRTASSLDRIKDLRIPGSAPISLLDELKRCCSGQRIDLADDFLSRLSPQIGRVAMLIKGFSVCIMLKGGPLAHRQFLRNLASSQRNVTLGSRV